MRHHLYYRPQSRYLHRSVSRKRIASLSRQTMSSPRITMYNVPSSDPPSVAEELLSPRAMDIFAERAYPSSPGEGFSPNPRAVPDPLVLPDATPRSSTPRASPRPKNGGTSAHGGAPTLVSCDNASLHLSTTSGDTAPLPWRPCAAAASADVITPRRAFGGLPLELRYISEATFGSPRPHFGSTRSQPSIDRKKAKYANMVLGDLDYEFDRYFNSIPTESVLTTIHRTRSASHLGSTRHLTMALRPSEVSHPLLTDGTVVGREMWESAAGYPASLQPMALPCAKDKRPLWERVEALLRASRLLTEEHEGTVALEAERETMEGRDGAHGLDSHISPTQPPLYSSLAFSGQACTAEDGRTSQSYVQLGGIPSASYLRKLDSSSSSSHSKSSSSSSSREKEESEGSGFPSSTLRWGSRRDRLARRRSSDSSSCIADKHATNSESSEEFSPLLHVCSDGDTATSQLVAYPQDCSSSSSRDPCDHTSDLNNNADAKVLVASRKKTQQARNVTLSRGPSNVAATTFLFTSEQPSTPHLGSANVTSVGVAPASWMQPHPTEQCTAGQPSSQKARANRKGAQKGKRGRGRGTAQRGPRTEERAMTPRGQGEHGQANMVDNSVLVSPWRRGDEARGEMEIRYKEAISTSPRTALSANAENEVATTMSSCHHIRKEETTTPTSPPCFCTDSSSSNSISDSGGSPCEGLASGPPARQSVQLSEMQDARPPNRSADIFREGEEAGIHEWVGISADASREAPDRSAARVRIDLRDRLTLADMVNVVGDSADAIDAYWRNASLHGEPSSEKASAEERAEAAENLILILFHELKAARDKLRHTEEARDDARAEVSRLQIDLMKLM
eukprot:GEMP01006181.1.p1 GENE.GEMP01006181.1~~GEMP01006181.1.p1  ORF type:complete len:850 (+),score=218.52 GEMP01006181.1:113-2662(+)